MAVELMGLWKEAKFHQDFNHVIRVHVLFSSGLMPSTKQG
jgi:hypothetical protein